MTRPMNFKPELLQKARLMAQGFSAKLRRPALANAFGLQASANGVRELYIYDAIGGWWSGITADWLRDELNAIKDSTTRLNIFVNSPGGDVFEAKAMLSLLQRFPAEKVLYVDGLAASAATFLAMGADRIVTAPHATWMIHDAWGGSWGNAKVMREYADLLDMVSGDIAGIYERRTKQSMKKLRELMAAETWMTATEAKELGFTDSVATFDEDNAAPTPAPEPKKEEPKKDDQAAALAASARARAQAFRALESMRREQTTK